MSDTELLEVLLKAEYRVRHDDKDVAEDMARETFREEIVPDGMDVDIKTNDPIEDNEPSFDTTRYTFQIWAEYSQHTGN